MDSPPENSPTGATTPGFAAGIIGWRFATPFDIVSEMNEQPERASDRAPTMGAPSGAAPLGAAAYGAALPRAARRSSGGARGGKQNA